MGKRAVNKSLKAWVAFVKRVQKEEKLTYPEAMKRAKARKDKGEKWMKGGDNDDSGETTTTTEVDTETVKPDGEVDGTVSIDESSSPAMGGKRRKSRRRRCRSRSRSRGRGRSRARTARKSRH